MTILSQLHKKYIAADTKSYEEQHKELLKTNHWYKVYYQTMCDKLDLKNKLNDIAGIINIHLEDYEQLPKNEAKDWEGYVLVLENSVKKLLKEAKEAEELVKKVSRTS
jgi:hypothetical protein